ncbi:hypothetical protein E3N88_22812 [Mikania micrantha]|uniref:Ty3 transposon capsid-like protein domain-containing protein n=1 Tax=Mikania micrantha TaxID=192012 RepID=A0A5N6NBI0_9ASTR|nr:hypothetical protein E3N88_22812 [Mikania micrantha]
MGHSVSSPVEPEDLTFEKGRKRLLTEAELRMGSSRSNISCKSQQWPTSTLISIIRQMELRLKLAQLSIQGVAQHWFTVVTQVHDSLTWTDFQVELLQRFSGLEIHNPYEQLATIKQVDSILDHIDDFEYLLSLVPRLSESQTLGYFIAGLREDVKKWVRLHRPQTCLDAIYLAKDVEAVLRPSVTTGPLARF